LDKKAAATLCTRHHTLRGELATLQLRYREFSEIAKDVAIRIQTTQETLADMTHNIDQVYCDTINALSSADTLVAAEEPSVDGKFQTAYSMYIY
jgi:hypothetical protein